MINPVLRGELLKAALPATAAFALGHLFDVGPEALILVLTLLLVRNLRQLVLLRRWFSEPKRLELPVVGGLWGEVYDALLALQKRHRKRKRKLAAMLSEFQASTAALPDGAVVLTAAGEIVWFNPSAQALLGLRLPQDLGLRIANLVRKPAFTDYFAAGNFEREIEAGSPINAAITLSFRIIPYGNGQRLLIVRDVSELRRLETARRDFVANASHELRTPLTVLRGYLDVMEPELDRGALAEWTQPIREMRAQAARMEALINDLLKLARLEGDVIQSRQDLLDVPKLLARVESEANALSGGRHRISFDVQPELRLFGRESELMSVITNLIANAIRYTPDGGIINVRWKGDERGAELAVADTGIGIAEADLPRVTERFYRVDIGRSRASGGTGLGLSIVKHALEHHEAQLRVDSEVGVGSTFRCLFPGHRVHVPSTVDAASIDAAESDRER